MKNLILRALAFGIFLSAAIPAQAMFPQHGEESNSSDEERQRTPPRQGPHPNLIHGVQKAFDFLGTSFQPALRPQTTEQPNPYFQEAAQDAFNFLGGTARPQTNPLFHQNWADGLDFSQEQLRLQEQIRAAAVLTPDPQAHPRQIGPESTQAPGDPILQNMR